MWLLVAARMKEHVQWKRHESEDINTAVTASLHDFKKDEYRAATDHLTQIWKKCVDSAGNYPEYGTHV